MKSAAGGKKTDVETGHKACIRAGTATRYRHDQQRARAARSSLCTSPRHLSGGPPGSHPRRARPLSGEPLRWWGPLPGGGYSYEGISPGRVCLWCTGSHVASCISLAAQPLIVASLLVGGVSRATPGISILPRQESRVCCTSSQPFASWPCALRPAPAAPSFSWKGKNHGRTWRRKRE